MIWTQDYDTSYPGPSLPVVEIGVRRIGADASERVNLTALIDSGADATILPVRILTQIKAPRVDLRRLRGAYGPSFEVNLHEVAIQIGPFFIGKIYAVADPQNAEIVLGRDTLNQFIVTLNGLASVVEMTQ